MSCRGKINQEKEAIYKSRNTGKMMSATRATKEKGSWNRMCVCSRQHPALHRRGFPQTPRCLSPHPPRCPCSSSRGDALGGFQALPGLPPKSFPLTWPKPLASWLLLRHAQKHTPDWEPPPHFPFGPFLTVLIKHHPHLSSTPSQCLSPPVATTFYIFLSPN